MLLNVVLTGNSPGYVAELGITLPVKVISLPACIIERASHISSPSQTFFDVSIISGKPTFFLWKNI